MICLLAAGFVRLALLASLLACISCWLARLFGILYLVSFFFLPQACFVLEIVRALGRELGSGGEVHAKINVPGTSGNFILKGVRMPKMYPLEGRTKKERKGEQ